MEFKEGLCIDGGLDLGIVNYSPHSSVPGIMDLSKSTVLGESLAIFTCSEEKNI